MKRRDFLKTIPLSLSLSLPLLESKSFGWVPPSIPDNKTPRFCATGRGKGKNIFLYNYVRSALRFQIIPHYQGDNPDCVSHAGGLGIEFVQAIQHFLNGNIWYGPIATEILHAGTRKIISPKSRGRKLRDKDGGISVHELILFLKEYGVLFRRKYQDFNFIKYDYKNCLQLLRSIPSSLLEECKKHSIQTFSKVTTWEEARDAIFNLQPVIVGSKVGFEHAKRDKDGFAKPRGEWNHAWILIGIKDRGRKGGCLMSSWGKNWIKGPKIHGQPEGSIWIDADVLHQMVKQYGDSYAISNFD